jgi:hypothetical protein
MNVCPACLTTLMVAPGIGPYCPNRDCKVTDDLEFLLRRSVALAEKGELPVQKSKKERSRVATAKWRKANPEKGREYSRNCMRRRRGAPAPTRPEPVFCECCGRKPNGRGTLHLDHDHLSGSFRGWLCDSCNRGIGMLGDCIESLTLALAYLQRASETNH